MKEEDFMMKRKELKAFTLIFALCMAVLLVLAPQSVSAKTKVVKVKSVSLNKKSVTVSKGKSVKLAAKLKPANTTQKSLVWSSSKKSVATVNSKGVVTGKKAGKAVITVLVKGTKVKAACKVTVTTPVSKITLSGNSKVEAGKRIVLTAKITPSNATNKKVTYKSSNTKVATVDSKGVVKGLKAGTATITVTAQDGSKKKATKKITVVAAASQETTTQQETTKNPVEETTTQQETTTEKPSVEQQTTSSGDFTDAVVSTQAELDTILKKIINGTITIKSDADTTFVIPEATHNGVSLIVDGASVNVINNGRFDSITIKEQSNGTFTENATGNTIKVESEKADVVVNENAIASISVSDSVKEIKIKEKGQISQIDVKGDAGVNISGTGANSTPIAVSVSGKGEVVTNIPLNVNADDKITLILKPGAEDTKITVPAEDKIPDMQGTTSVNVKAGEKEVEVTPEPVDDKYLSTITFSGNVKEAGSSDTAVNAKAYLVKYEDGMNIEEADKAQGVVEFDVTNGTYVKTPLKEGKFVFMIKADGYKTFIQVVFVTANENDEYCNETAELVKESSSEASKLSGKIVNSVNKEPIEGVTVELRRHKNVKDTEVIAATTTDADGNYVFDNIKGDNYTVTVIDNREKAINKFITTSFNACVDNNSSAIRGAALSEEMDENVIRFVLTWGAKKDGVSADMDAHVVGPTLEENKYCNISYYEKTYSRNGINYTQLDVDDTDYEGPETITIANPLPGKYYYFVNNYSNDGKFVDSDVRVDVYRGSNLIDTYTPNAGCDKIYWNVLIYDTETGVVTPVNRGSDLGFDIEYDFDMVSDNHYSEIDSVVYKYKNGDSAYCTSEVAELYSGYPTLKRFLEETGSDFDIKLKDGTSVKNYEIHYRGDDVYKKYCTLTEAEAIIYFEYKGVPVIYNIEYEMTGYQEIKIADDEDSIFDTYFDDGIGKLEITTNNEKYQTLKSVLDDYKLTFRSGDGTEFSDYVVAYKGEEMFEKYGKEDSDAVVCFKDFSEDYVYQIVFKYEEW